MRLISQRVLRVRRRVPVGAAAVVLGVLALVAAIVGIASWQRISSVAVTPIVVTRSDARVGAWSPDRHDEVRIASTVRNEKAHLSPLAPMPVRAARAHTYDGQDLRVPQVDGAAVVAVRDLTRWPAVVATGCRRAGWSDSPASGAESAGHLAANPARGPPDHRIERT